MPIGVLSSYMQSSSRLCIYIKIDSTKQFAHGFKYNNISRKS